MSSKHKVESQLGVGLDQKNWYHSVNSVLAAINYAMGEPGYTKLKEPLTIERLMMLANQLLGGSYNPRQWFNPESQVIDKNLLRNEPASSLSGQTFCLPVLPGWDSFSEKLNLRSGGVIYEDPFWFLLAAYNLSKGLTRFIIPNPESPASAWQSRLEVESALFNDQYQVGEWYAESNSIMGLFSDEAAHVLMVTGDELIKLRLSGRGTLADPELGLGMYVLYEYRRINFV